MATVPDPIPKLEESFEKDGVRFWVSNFGPGRLVPWTALVENIEVSVGRYTKF